MNQQKPTVLFLLHLPPPVHGSSVMGKAIFDSKSINNAFVCRYINLILSRRVDETGSLSFGKILRVIQIWLKLLMELIFHKPQWVYLALTATGAAFYKDVLLVVLLRLFRIKTVYHLHNKGFAKAAEKPLNKRLYRFVFNGANVILLSKRLYKDISDFVPDERVYICPNGIPETEVRSKQQEVSGKKSINKVNILFLSNLIESKGVYVLLEACQILKNKNIDFSCALIGGEGDITINQLNDKIQTLNLESNVQYVGKKYGAEKDSYWKNSDIFVFPTYYHNETFGLVNLEAMQHSLPVISTFEGGIPDLVVDGVTGYLVPQQNVQALAEKLEVLINNPELQKQMGEAGRKKYEKEFTQERFEERMVEILKTVDNG